MCSTFAAALDSLKLCSICLESYNQPKELPCQHSYCYRCLVNIASGQRQITCPSCREEHSIPERGISGFRNNLVINQLLSIPIPRTENCADCKAEALVSQCEHCGACICGQCLIQHAKLCMEITTSLRHLQEELMSPEAKKQLETKSSQLRKCRDDLQKDLHRQSAIIDNQLKDLKTTLERLSSLSQFIKSTIRIHDDLIGLSSGNLPHDSFVSSLTRKVDDCKTIKSLNELKKEMQDVKTVTRLIQRRNDAFRFSLDVTKHDLTEDVSVKYGQSLVIVQGTYDRNGMMKRLCELNVTTTENSGTDTVTSFEEDLNEVGAANSTWTATDGVSYSSGTVASSGTTVELKATFPKDSATTGVQTPNEEDATREQYSDHDRRSPWNTSPKTHTQSVACQHGEVATFTYEQNQLPKNENVNHASKGGVPTMIGQNKLLTDRYKLHQPYACAYHVGDNEIYVADGNDRVMIYSRHGNRSRFFYQVIREPRDLAISSDGQFVYLVKPTAVFKVERGTKKRIESYTVCSLGTLNNCRSAICYRGQLIVVERGYRSVFVFENGTEIRHFGQEHLKRPSMITFSPSSELFFVTDLLFSCVKVFTSEGQHVGTFAALVQHNDVSGIAVDADDYVYVARILSNRIDIYNPKRKLTRSITAGDLQHPLKSPGGLCLMPSGKLIVADTGNDRLQILG